MANTTSVAIRKKQLETRLNELNVRLHGIEKTLDKLPPADVEDRATEREEDEVLEGLGTAGLKEIEMIEAALARIKDSVYGECTKCGEAISGQRLDLLPYTPLCRNCA
ncbi:MAG: TraR/DksA C4-type zinc finger protein [Rhodobacterales bacterium]|jgi:RNA polymerase-binding transcription factor DksA|nr:TraR/DksA family transcriptional regulator [Rhodobacter sp.]HBN30618.1 dimethylmenaquinone methyltransferase [Paracoccaceae bacterium]